MRLPLVISSEVEKSHHLRGGLRLPFVISSEVEKSLHPEGTCAPSLSFRAQAQRAGVEKSHHPIVFSP